MHKELEEALRSLSVEELLEARRLIDGLLSQLEKAGGTAHQPPAGGTEKRRFPRYSINLAVTYFRHRAGSGEKTAGSAIQDAVVRDISRLGVRFFTSERLAVDEILTFYLPGPLGVRKLFVEITRSELRGKQYECGASFVGLDRVLAAQRTEEQRTEAAQVLVVGEPCPERDTLANLLLRQGYAVHMANSVPDALAILSWRRCRIVLAAGPLLLAEDRRLLKELQTVRGEVLSIAVVSASDMDGPDGEALRSCHDFISEPDRVQEVRVVLGRTFRRLTAAQARQARP